MPDNMKSDYMLIIINICKIYIYFNNIHQGRIYDVFDTRLIILDLVSLLSINYFCGAAIEIGLGPTTHKGFVTTTVTILKKMTGFESISFSYVLVICHFNINFTEAGVRVCQLYLEYQFPIWIFSLPIFYVGSPRSYYTQIFFLSHED